MQKLLSGLFYRIVMGRNRLVKTPGRGVAARSDGPACITGGIAEAFYGMPQKLRDETLKCLPEDIREGYELFRWNIGQR